MVSHGEGSRQHAPLDAECELHTRILSGQRFEGRTRRPRENMRREEGSELLAGVRRATSDCQAVLGARFLPERGDASTTLSRGSRRRAGRVNRFYTVRSTQLSYVAVIVGASKIYLGVPVLLSIPAPQLTPRGEDLFERRMAGRH